ncbi:MAG TPA: DUF86 domain-containing protein, partial [Polyangiales bacterium]|nr:DUF86 domain-containing protein [Polyangiales bacterium]
MGSLVVDAIVLRRRLDALLGYLDRLERFRAIERATFITDSDTHHLAERFLHLAMESVLDIANHLIADASLEAPETYRDAFHVLARHGVITAELAEPMQRWAGFRNVLVHAYLEIDHGISYDAIEHELDVLRVFAAVAAARL